MVTTGGTSIREDIYRLYKTVHILVATPGRVLDLANKQVADLSQVKTLVMDEADKLLSPDFQPIIEHLLEFLAPDRQILMYSATYPAAIQDFIVKYVPSVH